MTSLDELPHGAGLSGESTSPAPSLVYPPATKEDLDETGRLVEEQKKRFLGIVADTRDFAALKSAADRAVKDFGHSWQSRSSLLCMEFLKTCRYSDSSGTRYFKRVSAVTACIFDSVAQARFPRLD